MNNDIQIRIDNNRGSFYIERDGKQVAELDFEINNGQLNAFHTGVIKELEGQGLASKLFDEMVKYARENNYKVIPTCPYISAKFRRRPDEFNDIWVQSIS